MLGLFCQYPSIRNLGIQIQVGTNKLLYILFALYLLIFRLKVEPAFYA